MHKLPADLREALIANFTALAQPARSEYLLRATQGGMLLGMRLYA